MAAAFQPDTSDSSLRPLGPGGVLAEKNCHFQ
jgi:hypothetical protein